MEGMTPGDILNAIDASVFSCPEDDAWDNIRDQILSAQKTIIQSIDTYIGAKIDLAKSSLTYQFTVLNTSLVTPVAIIKSGVRELLLDMVVLLGYVQGQTSNWGSGIATIINSVTGGISNIIGTTVTSISRGIATILPALAGAVNSIVSTLGRTIAATFSSVVGTITTGFSVVLGAITQGFASVMSTVTTTISALVGEVKASIDWVANFVLVKLPEYISQGVQSLLDTLMDFVSWVPNLLGAMFGWAETDVPGSSPQGEGILQKIFTWIVNAFKSVMTWFAEVILKPIISALVVILSAIADIFRPVTQVLLDGVMNFLTSLGPIAPSAVTGTTAGLANIGIIIIGMLGAMTVAGHLIHPFQSVGLGEVSAMVWDMTNFRTVIGAFMGVVAALAIRVPLTYYLNESLRPQLPSTRDAMEMFSNEAITPEQFHQLLAYHGLADSWHPMYEDVAFRAVSVYSLRNLAASGLFDQAIFSRELTHAGYRPEIKNLLMRSWISTNIEQARGMFSGVAMTRYKEGYTNESEFRQELLVLGYPEEQLDLFIAGAELAYATDYITDLKSAYTAAAGKGQISLGEYRSALVGLGIRHERVNAFVLRVKATLDPKAKLTLIAGPTPVYETEEGKLRTDTLRRQRRKGHISRDQELAGFLELGMSVVLAGATADNDDARLAEKATEE
jgi:hypothetical protein